MLKVRTIAASRPFLDTLVQELLAWDRERLADALVLVPSRRACMAARDAFLRLSGGDPLLLPRLVPVGEPDGALPPLDADEELALPPAIGPMRRRLLLTRLVLARDPAMDGEAWRSVGSSHPQHGLKRLLALMEIDRAAVRAWPEADQAVAPAAR